MVKREKMSEFLGFIEIWKPARPLRVGAGTQE